MKKINYNVTCDNTKLAQTLSKDKKYIEKQFSKIIRKRRELLCYENNGNKTTNIKNEK